MKREIGPFGLLFISFTAIFGSGWLFAPFFAAQIAGPHALLAWLIGALMSAVIGITMAEVIVLFPRAGGINAAAQITHGPLLGFMTNCLMLVVCLILPVLEVRAILQYISSQNHLFLSSDQHITGLGFLAAALLLIIINWANLYGAKFTARLTALSMLIKLITPIAVCIFFLYTLSHQHGFHLKNLSPFWSFNLSDVFLAISTSGIIFSFNGFNQATIFAAEAKEPQKSIPFAILGSILVATLVYLLLQYVFLIAIPPHLLTDGWRALHFEGDSGPFAGLAILLGLRILLYFIYADAIISPLGTAFTYSSAAPRMFYAFSESSSLFPFLKRLNSRGVPIYSVLLSACLGFIAFVYLPNLKAMITVLVSAFVLNYTVAPISLIALRNSTTYNAKRIFKVPFAPVFSFFALFFSNIMTYCCGFNSLYHLLIVIGISFIIGCAILLRTDYSIKSSIQGALWFVLQLLALTFIAYGSDQHYLSFTQAMLAVGFTSLLSFVFARLRYTCDEHSLLMDAS